MCRSQTLYYFLGALLKMPEELKFEDRPRPELTTIAFVR
jgi:hypothetical protein